jgi:hypothetical protein
LAFNRVIRNSHGRSIIAIDWSFQLWLAKVGQHFSKNHTRLALVEVSKAMALWQET